jgi:predicted esterase
MAKEHAATQGPHLGEPILTAGEPLERATAALILVHGRGGTASGILALAGELAHPGFAFLAPQATGNTWYPLSFLAPLERNEPYLSSALDALAALLEHLAGAGIPAARTILLGFSQGACLILEFAARHTQRYGGLAGLSGGLIGPGGTQRNYAGSLAGTPVFLGCSDVDPHIPRERVIESGRVLERLGGEVTAQLYPSMGHTINQDELDHVRFMMATLGPTQNPRSLVALQKGSAYPP